MQNTHFVQALQTCLSRACFRVVLVVRWVETRLRLWGQNAAVGREFTVGEYRTSDDEGERIR
jgi:hypothetical protein